MKLKNKIFIFVICLISVSLIPICGQVSAYTVRFCKDTDDNGITVDGVRGINFSQKGTVTQTVSIVAYPTRIISSNQFDVTDYCIGNDLIEFFCFPDGIHGMTQLSCEDEKCVEGACVPNPLNPINPLNIIQPPVVLQDPITTSSQPSSGTSNVSTTQPTLPTPGNTPSPTITPTPTPTPIITPPSNILEGFMSAIKSWFSNVFRF